ncbi:hypothetical protein HK405_006787 [Cladochytrium tenue]|nr:hypothetical protein HK405_006787 [Cladochytrium tenue]
MDRIKEKLEKLRIESETSLVRAEKAEAWVKELQQELARRDTEAQNTANKITLLSMDLDRNTKRADESTAQVRVLEVAMEQAEKRAQRFEAENLALEKKLEDMTAQYQAVKNDLEQTLKSLDEL